MAKNNPTSISSFQHNSIEIKIIPVASLTQLYCLKKLVAKESTCPVPIKIVRSQGEKRLSIVDKRGGPNFLM